MLPNDDLIRWGEPPTDEREQALADRLADALALDREWGADSFIGAPPEVAADGLALVEVGARIEAMIETVLEGVGLAEETARPVGLRLRVLREAGPGRFVAVASTHAAPMALRDLRRVPDDADRVHLRTGDRVRLEVDCDREGYLTVLNVGPRGALHLLYPAPGERLRPCAAGEPLLIADVQMTPPAGRERVWAVWSRVPLEGGDVSRLVRPGAELRDMQRVQDAVGRLRPEEWHAVLLELDHREG